MNNALAILRRDALRIVRNPVAVIVTIGVCIIPSLYAWINILANWDPYASTSTMPVAVVIEDEGADIPDMGAINAGDMVRERLAENDQLAWTFVASEQEALDGVRAGAYYAAFVIPPDFTASLAHVLDGETAPAHIAYYVNEKANAIAPKVTDTGATELESQVSREFARVVGETVSERVAGAAGSLEADAREAGTGISRTLADAASLLGKLADDLDGTGGTIASARDAAAKAAATLADLDATTGKLSASLSGSLDTLDTARADTQASLTSLSQALNQGAETIAGIASGASYDIGRIAGDIGWAHGTFDAALSELRGATGTLSSLKDTLKRARDDIAAIEGGDVAQAAKEDLLAALDAAIADIERAIQAQTGALDRLESTADGIAAGAESVRDLSTSVAQATGAGAQGLTDLSSSLSATALPELSAALDTFAQAGASAATGLSSTSAMVEQARGALNALDAVLEEGGHAVSSTADALRANASALGRTADDLSVLASAQAAQGLIDLDSLDAGAIGSIMAEPVELASDPVFPVTSYGSGVAPFYTNLALWVGGFVLVAIYKLEVDRTGLGDFTPRDAFFGRWLLLVALGEAQALICCAGDVLLGIQCISPLAFIFAGLVESFVYVSIVFALAVAFKHVGKALAVLLVVLQIPGASGTYPIEMMPGFFQTIHAWLPFTYGIAAMREAVAGFYGSAYVASIAVLLVYLAPAMLIGLGARRHLAGVNALFDRRLAETDFMVCDRDALLQGRTKTEALARALLLAPENRDRVRERAERFLGAYPCLVRGGIIALVAVPCALLALMFLLHRTYALLACWICSLVIISAYLIVVEYLREAAERTVRLAQLKPRALRRLMRLDRIDRKGDAR